MISLDEEYIGMDANTIIVRALKVCGGVLCNLSNGNLLGAHFTHTVTPEAIFTGCTYLMNHFSVGANVTEMYFVADLHAWQRRNDKYANRNTLMSDLKAMFRYVGKIKVSDKNTFGLSVDVRFDKGTPANIGYRLTLPTDELIKTPSTNVKFVQYTRRFEHMKTPQVQPMGWRGRIHQLPKTTGGFTPFPPHHFVPV